MLASQLTLHGDGQVSFLTPTGLPFEVARDRIHTGCKLLVSLNQQLAGTPIGPCRELIVFNHEDDQ